MQELFLSINEYQSLFKPKAHWYSHFPDDIFRSMLPEEVFDVNRPDNFVSKMDVCDTFLILIFQQLQHDIFISAFPGHILFLPDNISK